MRNDPIELLENQELINKLRNHGYGEIIDTLLGNDDEIYTKKGRLNKSGACRVLQAFQPYACHQSQHRYE